MTFMSCSNADRFVVDMYSRDTPSLCTCILIFLYLFVSYCTFLYHHPAGKVEEEEEEEDEEEEVGESDEPDLTASADLEDSR